jgi:hypothetical protein
MEYNGVQESSGLIERAKVRSLCTKTQQNYIERSAKRVALQAGIYVHVSVWGNFTFLETKLTFIIQQSVLRQFQSLFQSELSTWRDLELHLSNESILSFLKVIQ